jgi:hypothetical protein
VSFTVSPPEIDPEEGLSRRGRMTIKFRDEKIGDALQDPYHSTRSTPAQGTYWTRWLARNQAYPGKFVRARHGFIVDPWDWDTFQDELYVIDTITRDSSGYVTWVLKDPVKLADFSKLPAPTNGKLITELKDYEDIGQAQGGAANSIQLSAEASAADDFYNGMAVKIYDQTGAGQERVISSYVGATRTAIVDTDWVVNPDDTSLYFVQALQIELDIDAAPYEVYGVPGWFRIGEEIITFTARSGNVLSWPSTDHRQAIDTPLETHKVDDNVQVCKVFIDDPLTEVLKWIYTNAGLNIQYIDTTTLAQLESDWFGKDYLINVALSDPEKPSEHVKSLVADANSVMFWKSIKQQLSMLYMGPEPPGDNPALLDEESGFHDGSLKVSNLDGLRLNTVAMYYAPKNGTADLKKATNYLRGEVYVDDIAKIKYGDERTQVVYTRWFGIDNDQAAKDFTTRRDFQLRDAPKKVIGKIDYKDFDFEIGEYRDVLTEQIPDLTGAPKRTRVLITKVVPKEDGIYIEARSTIFAQWFAFISPDGADYPDHDGYACISQNDGTMPDGVDGAAII